MEYKKRNTVQRKEISANQVNNEAIQLKDNRTQPIQCIRPLMNFIKKPLTVPGPGKGFIPFMGAQFKDEYRTQEHTDVLKGTEDQCPVKTFHQENDFASQVPLEGSKSKIGDAGILAHKTYKEAKDMFK